MLLDLILFSILAKADGQAVFKQNCTVCHGEKGEGNGPAAAGMNPKPRNLVKDKFKNGDKPEEIYKTVTNGLNGMPSFASLPEADRRAVADYVNSLRKK